MQTFTPTPDQIRAAENYLTALAFEGAVRPVVEAYQNEILARHQYRVAVKWVEMGMDDKPILRDKDAFLMSDEDAAAYFAECHKAREAAGLKVAHPDNCPLLEAENVTRLAAQALLEAVATTPGLEPLGRSPMLTLEARDKAIDLSVRLLAPYVGSADAIMGRLRAAA